MSTERRRIRRILDLVRENPSSPWAGNEATVPLFAMDDCAVIPLGEPIDLVIGTDFVRGTGFSLFEQGVLSYEDIGYYLVAANASDLAAMGAAPLGIVTVVRYTATMSDEDFESILRGIAIACSAFRMPLLGGDTGSYSQCVLSGTAFGTCNRGHVLLRSGGKPGDSVYVTGSLGRAGAALAYFTRAKAEGLMLTHCLEEVLANAWRRVCPPLEQGVALSNRVLSRCAIDTSDGLKASVRQLAEASHLDVVLFPQEIPIDPLARLVAEAMTLDPLAFACSDSVDFRLVFSSPKPLGPTLAKLFEERGWELYRIGEFRSPTHSGPSAWFEIDGKLSPVPGVEWAQSDISAIDQLRTK